MAKPLPIVARPLQMPTPNDVREELQRKLAEAPIAHAEALLSLYEFAQTLHDRGTLDLLRGLVGAGDDIIGRIAAALNSPQTIRAMRNMVALAQVMGSVDPHVFESLRDAAAEAGSKRQAPDAKAPGMWSILKRADSEDSLRALSAITDFLESFGRHLKNSQNSPSAE